MKILITNDDGIAAPGLEALASIAERFGEVRRVAPMEEHSGCSHQGSHGPSIGIERRGENSTAVDGYPIDCVRLDLLELHPDTELVLSGINPGANLGAEIYLSGTVAAARESAILGCRAIAISQLLRPTERLDWKRTAARATAVLETLLEEDSPEGSYWNVNLPVGETAAEELRQVRCPPDRAPIALAYEREEGGFRFAGRYGDRPMTPGHDVATCFEGSVAISRLSL